MIMPVNGKHSAAFKILSIFQSFYYTNFGRTDLITVAYKETYFYCRAKVHFLKVHLVANDPSEAIFVYIKCLEVCSVDY